MSEDITLCLYIAGDTPASQRARERFDELLERMPQAARDVVDVLAHPDVAQEAAVLVTPTIIRLDGEPRRVVGDLDDPVRVALELQLPLDDGRGGA